MTSSVSSSRKRKRPQINRSIWNTPDDWDQLIQDSTLSTSSISSRKPFPRGLLSLSKCCAESAGRGFKLLWEYGQHDGSRSNSVGRYWKIPWEGLPDHSKLFVRERVVRYWGGFLTLEMISELFLNPPIIDLDGSLLPVINTTERLKSLLPKSPIADQITTLRLIHAQKASDIAFAGLIYHLPNLEVINLKNCPLVGKKTVETVIKRCRRLRKINLKGTQVDEDDVKSLLEEFGERLECFKIDNVAFNSPDETFKADSYPLITHLCLPGSMMLLPSTQKRLKDYRYQMFAQNQAWPKPRLSDPQSHFSWETLTKLFPSITHLYLPDLHISPSERIDLPSGQLIKLCLGKDGGGPPVPLSWLYRLLKDQTNLKHLSIGHLRPSGSNPREDFEKVGEVISTFPLEVFKLQISNEGSREKTCDRAMSSCAERLYANMGEKWNETLKVLKLKLGPSKYTPYLPSDCKIEELYIPNMNIWLSFDFVSSIAANCPQLRSLDLSGTDVSDHGLFTILDGCLKLSRVHLSYCRGVSIMNRRNIFEAWHAARLNTNGDEAIHHRDRPKRRRMIT